MAENNMNEHDLNNKQNGNEAEEKEGKAEGRQLSCHWYEWV